MLYCDVILNGTTIITGTVCLNNVVLNPYKYVGFDGLLCFQDKQGSADPFYEGLNTRFILYYGQEGQPTLQVPLQPIPAQQFDIILGGQNCTISIYDKEVL